MRRLLGKSGRIAVRPPGSSDDRVSESTLSIPGLGAIVFRDAHLSTYFQSPLSEGRRIDDRPGTSLDLGIDQRGPLWWKAHQLALGFVKTSMDVMNEI